MSDLCVTSPLLHAQLASGFCAFEIPVSVDQPRSVLSIDASSFLVLERGSNSVVLLTDTDDDSVADRRQTLVSASGLNHGLALDADYLYASSSTTVYRWPYDNNDLSTISSNEPEIVVNNINADGQGGAPFGHTTRTLALDKQNRLYISVGSSRNVDPDSFRSRIRRFDIDASLFPIDFVDGEVFADGLRNEVGLAFDRHGILWGVENGADKLQRSDLGGDITEDNPAEELNRFPPELVGAHFGYPYCWTEYALEEGLGRGTVWAWPSFLEDGVVTDEDCRNDYVPPSVSMQAHSAPLGITFYRWQLPSERPAECVGVPPFPQSMDGYAFIAFHGSWNRDVPTGYKVVYVAMDANGTAIGEPVDLLAHVPPNAQWEDGFRPVDVDFDACGRLLVTSDGSRNGSTDEYEGSKVVRIQSTEFSDSGVQSSSPAELIRKDAPTKLKGAEYKLGPNSSRGRRTGRRARFLKGGVARR